MTGSQSAFLALLLPEPRVEGAETQRVALESIDGTSSFYLIQPTLVSWLQTLSRQCQTYLEYRRSKFLPLLWVDNFLLLEIQHICVESTGEIMYMLHQHLKQQSKEKQERKDKMAFCYRFKLRIPHPKEGNKILNFKLMVPFKSRKLSRGRFGYSTLEEDTKFLSKALQFFKHRTYQTL